MSEGKRGLRKRIYPYLCIFGILVSVGVVYISACVEEKRKKEETYHMLELYGVRTEALLNGLFHKTDVLESVIITNHGQLDQDVFDNLAEALMDGKGIRAIQSLPGGVVTYCYPLEGNESVIGDNIFENPERRGDALLAMETKNIVLSGPYHLTQGGFGLVARNPVFLYDQKGYGNFWGFSVLVLSLPEALEPLMLQELSGSGYEYELSCMVNGELVIVDSSRGSAEEDGYEAAWSLERQSAKRSEGLADSGSIQVDIHVPNHIWQLKVMPEEGWQDKRTLAFEGLMGLCFTVLITVIIYLLERQGEQMSQYATTDELTGLFNRRRLKEYMDIRCRDKKVMFAMFYIDLNRFKQINDNVGHACGDAVLREAGRRIKTALGKEGSVYRLGGDEFIAVMELDVSEESCAVTALRIREELGKPFEYENHRIHYIGASIGSVIFPTEGEELDQLMKLADQRMYCDKTGAKEAHPQAEGL